MFHILSLVSYFYPRPPRGGRRNHPFSQDPSLQISIHALREEGDRHNCQVMGIFDISIHALREEGDTARTCVVA